MPPQKNLRFKNLVVKLKQTTLRKKHTSYKLANYQERNKHAQTFKNTLCITTLSRKK